MQNYYLDTHVIPVMLNCSWADVKSSKQEEG